MKSYSAPPLDELETAKIILKYWDGANWVTFWTAPDTIGRYNYNKCAEQYWTQAAYEQAKAQDRHWIVREWRVLPTWLQFPDANQYAKNTYGTDCWDTWGRVKGYIMGGPFIDHWSLVTMSPPYPQAWEGNQEAKPWLPTPNHI